MARKKRQLTSTGKEREYPEDALQKAVVDLLAIYERQGHLRFHATPNGGKRNMVEAIRMKGLGVRRGVPDLCIMLSNGPTIWIELKAPKGSVTDEQLDFIAWASKHGHHAWVARSVEEVENPFDFSRS